MDLYEALMCRVVAYYRVSTDAQGRSGLGLDAQRESVTALCRQRSWEIIAEFTEIESGASDQRFARRFLPVFARNRGRISPASSALRESNTSKTVSS